MSQFMENPLFAVENLSFSYDSGFLLKLSLSVNRSETSVIIGPNGAGKTTLLNIISGLSKKTSRSVYLDSINISEINKRNLARRIALVRQNSLSSVKGITGEELVALGRLPYRKRFQIFETAADMKIIREAMEITDTLSFANRALENLSGGELKRLYIAKAIAQEPEIIILDEPTNHLDLHHQIKILDLLKELQRKNNLTIIMTLHDLNMASEYADKIFLLNQGALHAAGTPSQVISWENIEKVYQTPVIVRKSPLSDKPFVFLVSDNTLKKWDQLSKHDSCQSL